MSEQLAMPYPHRSSYAAADFIVSHANRLAYDAVMQWPNWPQPFCWIYGPAAAGKSHLGHIWAERSAAISLKAEHLDNPTLLHHSAYLSDDETIWQREEAAFHLLNHLRSDGAHLLCIHHLPPHLLKIGLADLASRLNALPAYGLNPPDDDLIRALFIKLFADRQLSIPADCIDYLLPRVERECAQIAALVALIDEAALREKRAITIPLIRDLLQQQEQPDLL